MRLFARISSLFRATDGRVGFLQEACPHRCASLALARNEGNGLRCIFHGWKFSVEGQCVDAPTEPAQQRERFARSVPVRSHPTHEAGNIVWVYMGKAATPPRFPDYEFTGLPLDRIQPTRGIIRTNWLQGLEALLDSAHVGFLQLGQSQQRAGPRLFQGRVRLHAQRRRAELRVRSTSPTASARAPSATRARSLMPACARSRCLSSRSFPSLLAERRAHRLLLDPHRRRDHRAMVYRLRYRRAARLRHIDQLRPDFGRSHVLQCRHGRPGDDVGTGPRRHEGRSLERHHRARQCL